jgi:hypothetical protein
MAKFRSVIRHLTLQDGPQEVPGRNKDVVTVHPRPWAEFAEHVFETADAEVADRLRGLHPSHGITEVTEDAAPAATPAS